MYKATTAKLNCIDYNSAICQQYADKGYCSLNIYVNGAIITTSCGASCNPLCKVATTTGNKVLYIISILKSCLLLKYLLFYTVKATTTTLKTTCIDYNSDLCQQYKIKGYCSLNIYVNGAIITTSCGASCNPSCQIPTTTIKSTTLNPTCIDYNSNLCQQYKIKGYCSLNVYVNGAIITTSCAASCNPSCSVTTTVKTTTTNKCSDYNSALCQTYASKGYCSLNIYINNAPIKVSCAVSCNSCQ